MRETADRLMSREELEAALREIGATRYHHLHPFQTLLQDGRLNRAQVQAWALNRYYYQANIPVKDAYILARLGGVELRREWRQRILDHDGSDTERGGIEKWIALTDGVGLDRAFVESGHGILAGTRFAVDAYVHFVRERSLLEAIASSLTELFSPNVIGVRTRGMLAHYTFISKETLAYFDKRPVQAKRDSDFALDYCLEHATTAKEQAAVMDALRFKCQVLWAQLDALYYAYVEPGFIPPDAWRPGEAEAGGETR
ncbi:pyrroloquinoline-quinone synthase PqqC [Jiella sp. MQZ9-1]|uniref:Pyrroloquinoline-quinone synthase n=1 Tax=Jiella flava TaxID=2816857 RepID=A0A939FZ12_9HYPH|nr:pyrroloquinoline-quinone synthase PqqC [Jiella flava]MBO0664200.1 pyrroloquinoline-quinone synthase PqqC [Jiella flava]MCD2472847.1 pyrroloquinoline-quinone synthase PqqC [Jiella flava]